MLFSLLPNKSPVSSNFYFRIIVAAVLWIFISCARQPCDALVGKWGIKNDTSIIRISIHKIGTQYQVYLLQNGKTKGFLSPCYNDTLKGNGIEISYSEIGDYISVSGVSFTRK
jgi:hypothetical protein